MNKKQFQIWEILLKLKFKTLISVNVYIIKIINYNKYLIEKKKNKEQLMVKIQFIKWTIRNVNSSKIINLIKDYFIIIEEKTKN